MKRRVFYSERKIIIIFCLLAVLLIFGSGCIDAGDGPDNENKSDTESRNLSEAPAASNQSTFSNYESDAESGNLSEVREGSNPSTFPKYELGPASVGSPLSGVRGGSHKSAFSEYYSKEYPRFEAKAAQYSFPLNESEIVNLEAFSQKIPLSPESRAKLRENGFVVINGNSGLVNKTYRDLKVVDVPVFITTDSLLHLYHIQFDESLKRAEEEEFYDELCKFDRALFNTFRNDYYRIKEDDSVPDEVKEATRRNVAYFAVALSLLEGKPEPEISDPTMIKVKAAETSDSGKNNFKIPQFVKKDVEAELELIYAERAGISPIFKYEEDYSQYIPRGHYTNSEKLNKFFRAVMWHGRMAMLIQPDMINAADPEKEARIQTIQAFLIADYLDRHEGVRAGWDRIYEVTAFYVGFSDDLGPYEYAEALDNVFKSVGNNRRKVTFTNKSLEDLKVELQNYESPRIYGGPGNVIPAGPETESKTLDASKGFRLMGQRYTPDADILQSLGPSALNVMTLLGSERAGEHLKNQDVSEDKEYKKRHSALKSEFEAFDAEDWNQNLYWAQLYALKPLLVSYPEGYPSFMQTRAWEDKQLNTALASWTELKHDTILFAKMARFLGTPPPPPEEKPVEGYVEPVPEFYARMLALTKMAHTGLAEMEVLDKDSDKRFTALESALNKLLKISIKELENKELTAEEYEFIRNFGKNIAPMLENVDIESQYSTMIADVYTYPRYGVLEEGTGGLDLIVVAYRQPDGRVVLGAGPVMTYYEFWQPPGNRLTDEDWRKMLRENPPNRPEWVSSFRE